MSSSSPPSNETKLTIRPIKKPSPSRKCQAPDCKETATVMIGYDHGFGVEHFMRYCDDHHAVEVVNVAIDNRNVQAGFILF